MRALACLFVLVGLAYAKNEAYDGYSLYEVSVENINQVSLVNGLETSLELDIWSHALPGRPGQVLVPAEKKQLFEDSLKDLGVEYEVQTENIKELLELEEEVLSAAKTPFDPSRVDSLTFDRILEYEEVNSFLEALAEAYPETVTLVNGGKSFEGRDIYYLKISTTNFEDTSKPIVFIETLLHAREWITLPASLYAIKKLVIDVTETDVLEDIDWIIVPIANPDGYSFTHTTTRLWRKNRATGYAPQDSCIGVDLNRNFDAFWSSSSSNNPCSDTFHGRAAFSEPETAVIRDIFAEYRGRIELFLDIHSFGSMILYGYGNGTLAANGLQLHVAGVLMAQAIDAVKCSYNIDYIVGNSALVLYATSGSAQDYSIFGGATFGYTYELPRYRGNTGTSGFLVDPAFIEQAGFETWQGIKAGARYARNTFAARRNAN